MLMMATETVTSPVNGGMSQPNHKLIKSNGANEEIEELTKSMENGLFNNDSVNGASGPSNSGMRYQNPPQNLPYYTQMDANQMRGKPNDLPYGPNEFSLDQQSPGDGLGPLPPKWEKAITENGEVYFIDHNTGTSHWLDPRLSKFQKKSLEDCMEDELPYGWEKIHDPQYGTYYIDHVNRRTQYENPVLEAKRRAEHQNREMNKSVNHFTRNPAELRGERITTTLLKSSRGLGFTIVGGDDNTEEFLQIKSIVRNGPAWLDGTLQTGDILVYVNDTCVLGFTHHEMVNVFQSILQGETVTLQVCRGYPLPFDTNDPNTEVVTTIAVDSINADPTEKERILMDLTMDGNYNFLDISDQPHSSNNKNGSLLMQADINTLSNGIDGKNDNNEIIFVSIVKGILGFGFTIADSATGQKVKKILDRNGCKSLIEGDLLLAINNVNVKDMSHSEVVQVLKDCPKNQEAVLKIQRNPNNTLNHLMKGSKFRRSGDSSKYSLNSNKDFGKTQANKMFRSKTPTADLYSTQQKEVLPVRPKTPLVGVTRSKTPVIDNVDSTNGQDKTIDDTKSIQSDAKTQDHDSINNETIPFMDPYPKSVANLASRLNESMTLHHHQTHHQPIHPYNPNAIYSVPHKYRANTVSPIESNYDYPPYIRHPDQRPLMNVNNYNQMNDMSNSSVYSGAPTTLPIMAPVPTYQQEVYYCYECQEYGRCVHHGYTNMTLSPVGMEQRVNDFMMDNRKAMFSPLEAHRSTIPEQMHQSHLGHLSPQQHQFQRLNPTNELPSSEIPNYSLAEVTLLRQQSGFGFRIVGGTEEGSQVTVGHVVPGGSADNNPNITTGDEIISIDGVNVVNASHHRVVQLMGDAGRRGQVTMILKRKSNRNHTNEVNMNMNMNQMMTFPYDVIVSRNENEGFGFVLLSSSNQYYGSTIGKIIPGSPADRCERLKVGDLIIAVNRHDIAGISHGDVVNLIKDSGLHVRLTIGSRDYDMNTMIPGNNIVGGYQSNYLLTDANNLSPNGTQIASAYPQL